MRMTLPVLCVLIAACSGQPVAGPGTGDTAGQADSTRPAGATGHAGAPGAGHDFDTWWHDGRAELDGYALTVSRYGEPRRGQAVMIFVTEPFSETRRVKVDDPSRDPADTFDALKLNFVRDFQTGIYDYNTMISLFVRSSDFDPVKLAFSSAEWCGQVYQEMIFRPRGITNELFSYFDGETTSDRLDAKPDGIVEDALFVLLRGLKGDFLPAGGSRAVPFLPSPFISRLSHRPVAWTTAEIERLESTAEVEVKAGRFQAITYVVTPADGRVGRFEVEAEYPHRILRWSWEASGEAGSPLGGTDGGELTGSARLEYWRLHDNGQESYLGQLGLSPGPPGP